MGASAFSFYVIKWDKGFSAKYNGRLRFASSVGGARVWWRGERPLWILSSNGFIIKNGAIRTDFALFAPLEKP
jgi:hypothetical protein